MRGRNPLAWFGIGLLISPVIAAVMLAVAAPLTGSQGPEAPRTLMMASISELIARLEELFARGAMTPNDHARIKALAARELPAPAQRLIATDQTSAFTYPCPRCSGLIHPQATTCMHCWAKLGRATSG
jgi:hypothetical protein